MLRCLSPLRGSCFRRGLIHKAHAVGYRLPPLRGWAACFILCSVHNTEDHLGGM